MKVLFTADLHIKLGQKNVPIDFQINRYRVLFSKLASIECDLLVLGGDVFDRVPTMPELGLYFEMLEAIKDTRTIIYPGNHEAVKKNTTFLSNLSLVTLAATDSNVRIIDDFLTIDNMDFIPYNRLKEPWPDFSGNICFTHVRGEIPPHVKPEIDLSLLDRWTLVLAGDLHSHSNSQRNIVYPGSPLTTSFHRNEVDSGIIMLDSESLQWEFTSLGLPQLLRKTVSSPEEMIPSNYHHTIYEIEGDVGSLTNIKNSELLDKKIIKREQKSKLNLVDLTLEEELKMYLKEVLNIGNVEEVVKEANDYIKDAELE
jgi:DNA repair exonuclease SbcCD nuclease subunit